MKKIIPVSVDLPIKIVDELESLALEHKTRPTKILRKFLEDRVALKQSGWDIDDEETLKEIIEFIQNKKTPAEAS